MTEAVDASPGLFLFQMEEATGQALEANSMSAGATVTLDGQTLDSHGGRSGARRPLRLPDAAGRVAATVAPRSALLVTLAL